MPELIRLDGAEKVYGAVRALGPVTTTLEHGAWGLLGPNGAGKTTLILLLLGILHGRGSSRVLGLDPTATPLEVRSRVGYVPEGDSFVPGYTGVGFVAFCGELTGMRRADALGRAHEVLDYVGLGEARYRKVTEYSTGMRQRAKLAAALVHDPEFLILDEPTNGLDPAGRKEMLALLHDLATRHKKPLLYASHVLPDVEAVCDNIMILEAGQLKFQGGIRELMAHADRTFEVEVSGDVAGVAARLRDAGVAVRVVDGAHLSATLPRVDAEELILRAVVDAGAKLRGLRRAGRDLEGGFTDVLAEVPT